VSVLIGLILILLWRVVKPIYFTGETFRTDAAMVGVAPVFGGTEVVSLESFDEVDPDRPHLLGPEGAEPHPGSPSSRPPSDDSPTTSV
jgi:hypothetical protein